MTHAYKLAQYRPKTHGEMVYTTINPFPPHEMDDDDGGYVWDAAPPYAAIAYFVRMERYPSGEGEALILAPEEIPGLQRGARLNSIDSSLHFFVHAISRDGIVPAPIFSTLKEAQVYYIHRLQEQIADLDAQRGSLEEALREAEDELGLITGIEEELTYDIQPPAPFLPPRLLSSGPPEAD